jgi:N-acetylglucosaminyl-diphospho-decaprenol L-rhamnosyltransferase
MNPNRPRVDLGVVTWNSASLTARSLRRTLDQDQGCDIRVLVHDNGSTDDTLTVLAETVPEAEVESSPENLGFARAMNRLVSRSEGPWFFALNSDAWADNGAIGTLVTAAESHSRCAAVAPLLLRPDGSAEASAHPFPSVKTALVDVLGGRAWMPRRRLEALCLEGSWQHDRPRRVDWAVGAALLMRRDTLEQLGGFDERFFMYAEDLEWCWRASEAGWEIRFEPAALVHHLGNASGSKRWGHRRMALEAANLRVLLPEMMGTPKATLYRWLQAVSCAERAWWSRSRGRRTESEWWGLQLKAHVGLDGAPPVDSEFPETTAVG